MSQTQLTRRNVSVILAIVFVLIFFVIVIVALSMVNNPTDLGTPDPPSAQSYRARVDALLAIGHPEDGGAVFAKYTCLACHASNGDIAPSWTDLVPRAATRRPPMPADAYIYESIVNPGAFVVEGYSDVMPHDFGTLMTDQELADLLTYILSLAPQ